MPPRDSSCYPGGGSDRGLGTGSALAHQRVLKPGGGCEGGGEREARMPVADWTIQRQAFSGPLRGGGGRSLVPARDTPAQCCRAPLWRCRPIPVLFARGTALGVAKAGARERRGCRWPTGRSSARLSPVR